MMAKKALVLGGGGVLGIAWEVGVLSGLRDGGANVAGADLIVGTCAGSVVGTRMAQGTSLDDLMAEQLAPPDGSLEANLQYVDLAYMMTLFQKWARYAEITQQACAEIGRMALAAKTGPEEQWLDWFQQTIGAEWPARELRVTAVDAESGEFRAWRREDGVSVPFQLIANTRPPTPRVLVVWDGSGCPAMLAVSVPTAAGPVHCAVRRRPSQNVNPAESGSRPNTPRNRSIASVTSGRTLVVPNVAVIWFQNSAENRKLFSNALREPAAVSSPCQ